MTNQTTIAKFIEAYGCDAGDSAHTEACAIFKSAQLKSTFDADLSDTIIKHLENGDLSDARAFNNAEDLGLGYFRVDGNVVDGLGHSPTPHQAYAMKEGMLIRVGHREECEQAAIEAKADYGWIVNGRLIHRTDFADV